MSISAQIVFERKPCFQVETRQNASVADEDDPFKMLSANFDELKSRDAIDESFEVEDYVDFDIELCMSEINTLTDKEIVNSVLDNDCVEEGENKDASRGSRIWIR